MISHTHEYRFWHAHEHAHNSGLPDYADERHGGGHYHLWFQTHSHGDGVRPPHSHKDRQYHPEDDGVVTQHHAPKDHDYDEPEHHPECKLPYYGGGMKGCIDRCASQK